MSSQVEVAIQSPSSAMYRLISGLWISRAIYAAAKLGLADLLHDQPQSSIRLAELTETHAPSLFRLLRVLASIGIVTQKDSDLFELTPLGDTLRSGSPGSMRAWAQFQGDEENYRSWGALMHSLETGETAFDHLYGMGIWQYRSEHPEQANLFDEAMSNLVGMVNPSILASYDFSRFARIVDVGGGNGSLLAAILSAHPAVRGAVFDVPHVAERARQRIASAGLSDRCEVIGGSFFESVPAGADAYLLSRVIHDWDDERSIAIFTTCRRAMRSDSQLLVVERVIPPVIEESPTSQIQVLSDLLMMVKTGGIERTEAEYSALFEAAGLRLAGIVPTSSYVCVIEAVLA